MFTVPPSPSSAVLGFRGKAGSSAQADWQPGKLREDQEAGPASRLAADESSQPVRAEELPLSSYSELSISSVRARLRSLDVVQIRKLLGYEKAHADRPDVVSMFERRIANLEAVAPGAPGESSAEHPLVMTRIRWCRACGGAVDSNDEFCGNCGHPISHRR